MADEEYRKAYAAAYDRSFRVAYRQKFVEQCLASGAKAAAAGYDLKPVCTCAADALLASQTVEQLAASSNDPLPQLQLVAAQCLSSNPTAAPSKP